MMLRCVMVVWMCLDVDEWGVFSLRRMHHLTSVGDSQSNTLIVSRGVITGGGELGD